MLRVASDTAGIRTAMRELCEHSMHESKSNSRIAAVLAADGPDSLEQIRKLAPRSRISPGYQDWTLYLLWLERKLDAGISFRDPLTAEEAEGLTAISEERAKYNHDHPPCPSCGVRLMNRAQHRCQGCGKELH